MLASESSDGLEIEELKKEMRQLKLGFEDQIKELKDNVLKGLEGKLNGHEKWIHRIESETSGVPELRADLAKNKEEKKKYQDNNEKEILELKEKLAKNNEEMKKHQIESEERYKSLKGELQVKDTRIFILEEKINEIEEKAKGNEVKIEKLSEELKVKGEQMVRLEAKNVEIKEKYIQLYYQLGEKGEKILQVEEMIWKKSGEISEQMMTDRETNDRQIEEIRFRLNEAKLVTHNVLVEKRCPLIWHLTDFKQKFTESKTANKAYLTPVFYCLNGYKGRLQIYLNGTRECQGNHISVYFDLVESPFDDFLTWPMPYEKFTITLTINNKQVISQAIHSSFHGGIAREAYIRPSKKVTSGLGPRNFLPHKDLPSTIKNDTLIFKFDIE